MARLLTVMGGLALVAVLLVGCGGGGDDRATVEASLQRYFSTINPEDSDFPTGAGPPLVRDNSCVKLEPAPLTLPHCAVTLGTYRPTRVAVMVQGTEVLTAMPDPVRGRVRQAPARTYTG